ncbi:FAD-binding oxidoreductase [Govanella unica]|uniref:D-lactate dehydrogenase (cytochrome) n=1 Tax=Govanella unica TaxID=2975056 RepID=A0A9X3TZN6_9PROT|nr:FAD-binding oxidoreductase [Govania unica]MDA5194422.1 FAD-binding oxidoreductase [Govania unica]
MQSNPLLGTQLKALLPDQSVDCDPDACALAAQDLFSDGPPVVAVLRPRDMVELIAAVKVATDAGATLFPRGGGMSYTSGYLSKGADANSAVTVDIRALNRIIEINVTDMYVLVEAGCTWAALDGALREKGLRTPFWGPLSGIQASVGGALSQNAAFWGSGCHGAAADSVLGLEVILADGTVLRSGSLGRDHALPFFRHHGPDLTGIFLGDCGAFGIKARVSLRLIERAETHAVATFGFTTVEDLIPAISAISRAGLASEHFAFDRGLKSARLKRASLREDMAQLIGLMRNSGSLTQALSNAVRTVFAGRRFLDRIDFPLHVMVEGRSDAAVAADLRALRKIIASHSGVEVEPSIPRILQATPFGPLNGIVGPRGERWVPVHVVIPHSRAQDAYRSAMNIFADMKDDFARHDIQTGCLFAGVGTNGFLLELMFFWPDRLLDLHQRTLSETVKARLTQFPPNEEGRSVVIEARHRLRECFAELGGCHFQIGKFYPYMDGLNPRAAELIKQIKRTLDPDSHMNPGSLGLGQDV